MAPSSDLASPTTLTRWIVLQKARRHSTKLLRHLVGTKFQDLFHSPPGVLFTFPSLYWFTIDQSTYLALAGGPAGFKQGFSCPVLLDKRYLKPKTVSLTGLSPRFAHHSRCFSYDLKDCVFSHSVNAVGFYAKYTI